jgi:SAM-dependent methyltransferase
MSELSQASYHEIRFQHDARRSIVWRVLARYLQRWVNEDEALLELGAGYGEFTREIKAREKWALDQNPALKEFWDSSVHAIFQSAMDDWPIPDASLGTVFASNFFEHFTIDDGAEILGQIERKLKAGGRFIAVQPNFRLEPRRYFDDYTHRTAFTDNGFQDFLRAYGWKILHCEPRFTPFTMKSRIPTAEWLIRLYLALPFRPFAGQFLVVAERP